MAKTWITEIQKEKDLKRVLERALDPLRIYAIENGSGGRFGMPDLQVIVPYGVQPYPTVYIELKLARVQNYRVRWETGQWQTVQSLLLNGARVLLFVGVKNTEMVMIKDLLFQTELECGIGDHNLIKSFIYYGKE